jgi:uncharacterized short protein YbdD (DUF466 family)
VSATLATVLRTVRRIIGEPDYAAYLRHMAAHHPGCAVLSERAFVAQRLDDRYSRPGSRCC